MAYPRRHSGSSPRSTTTTPGPAAQGNIRPDARTGSDAGSDSDFAFAPPRPFFLASNDNSYRSSSSSFDSADPGYSNSDSDPDLQPPAPAHAHSSRLTGSQRGYAAIPAASTTTHSTTTTGTGSRHRKRASMTLPPPSATTNSDTEKDALAPPPSHARRDSGSWTPTSLYQDAGLPASPFSPSFSSPSFATPAAAARATTPPAIQNSSPRPPPSSFAFPFQAYPGNPDPLPYTSRRRSVESIPPAGAALPSLSGHGSANTSEESGYHPLARAPSSGSLGDLRKPFAPFMAGGANASGNGNGNMSDTSNGSSQSLPRSASSNSLYKASAAAGIASPSPASANNTSDNNNTGSIPRTSSVHSFRAPFLSPASRPTSSLWSPPSYAAPLAAYTALALGAGGSPAGSSTALPLSPLHNTTAGAATGTTPMPPSMAHAPSPYAAALSKSRPPLPSTRLPAPLSKADKPWLASRAPRTLSSYFLTLFMVFLGAAGAAVLCWQGVASVLLLDESDLCSILDESYTGGGSSALDTDVWTREVQLGGFGNGEFEMTTSLPANLLFTSSLGMGLYPTLTSASGVLSSGTVFDGANYTLDGCTEAQVNASACSVSSSESAGTVVNPVMSARMNTKGKKEIRYGKVEVRARMPTGDWLWPSIFLLPANSTYGAWPASGEIDIVEARGNAPTYGAQGNNFVRASLNYGPMVGLVERIYGWYSLKRSSYATSVHTYTLEWTPEFIRVYVDSRVQAMLLSTTKKQSYWQKGGFPQTAVNASSGVTVVVPDPWKSASGVDGGGSGGVWDGETQGTQSAPFDQAFYLTIALAAGGTSGWFPDGVGDKPWFDGSSTAMRDFAKAQDTWSATWPEGDGRGFWIESVKMWSLGKCS